MTYFHVQRVYGFAICLGLGLLFGFLVSHLLTQLLHQTDQQWRALQPMGLKSCFAMQSSVFFLMPVKFAILYTLANLLFIGR